MSALSLTHPVGTIVEVFWPDDGKKYQGVVNGIRDGKAVVYFPSSHSEWLCTDDDMKNLVSVVSVRKSKRGSDPNTISAQVPAASRISQLGKLINEILISEDKIPNPSTPRNSSDLFTKVSTEISALLHNKDPDLVSNLTCVFHFCVIPPIISCEPDVLDQARERN